jgi:threonine dehydrogenase-like Zn-dependent dehydrogenase
MKACYGNLNSEWLISLGLMDGKKIQTKPLITKIIGLAEIQGVFQELLKPDTNQVQVVVDCK